MKLPCSYFKKALDETTYLLTSDANAKRLVQAAEDIQLSQLLISCGLIDTQYGHE